MIRRALLLVLLATGTLNAQVTFERLLNADQEPENWLTYSGNNFGQRYSSLTSGQQRQRGQSGDPMGVAGPFAREVRDDRLGR